MTERSESRHEATRSEPSASHDDDAGIEPPLADDRLSIWTGRLAVAAFVGLLLFAVVAESARERDRWRAAGAYRTYLTAFERDDRGRIDEAKKRERILVAVDELREALGPDADARWRAVEAGWLLEAGETEAARTILDELVEARPKWLAVRADRMTAALMSGDAKQVVADCDWLEAAYGERLYGDARDPVSGASFSILIPNLRAYMLALANEKLDVAEKEIDRAIAATENDVRGDDFGRASLLDTLGYVVFRQGDFDRAAKLLDQAVDLLDKPAAAAGEDLGALQFVREYRLAAAKAAKEDRRQDLASLERSRAVYERAQALAVMFYHRALVRRARGDDAQAEADLRVVEELGFEANEKLF